MLVVHMKKESIHATVKVSPVAIALPLVIGLRLPMNHLQIVEMSKYRRIFSTFSENIRLQNDILIFYRRITLDEK